MTGERAKTARKTKAKPPAAKVEAEERVQADVLVRAMLDPYIRHGAVAEMIAHRALGKAWEPASAWDYAAGLRSRAQSAEAGNLAEASRLLMAQTLTLDAIFTEMARRMACNMGEHLNATETYARIALKAQSNSRATLEALAKLHQPREQTVRHVHVNEGGQAVIADQFHHHAGGPANAVSAKQSHAQSPCGPALPCPDAIGPAVPVTSREGQSPVQDARRN